MPFRAAISPPAALSSVSIKAYYSPSKVWCYLIYCYRLTQDFPHVNSFCEKIQSFVKKLWAVNKTHSMPYFRSLLYRVPRLTPSSRAAADTLFL